MVQVVISPQRRQPRGLTELRTVSRVKYWSRLAVRLLSILVALLLTVDQVTQWIRRRQRQSRILRAREEQRRRHPLLLKPKEEYRCVGWHTTEYRHPPGLPRMIRYARHSLFGSSSGSCDEDFSEADTGYCELVDLRTGEHLQVFHQTYVPGARGRRDRGLKCSHAHPLLLHYKELEQEFQPNPPLPFMTAGGGVTTTTSSQSPSPPPSAGTTTTTIQPQQQQQRRRGIVMSVNSRVLASLYAIVQLLRNDYNCQLPIELWVQGGEDDVHHSIVHHPIMKAILSLGEGGGKNDNQSTSIALRFHWDYRFTERWNKVYAIAYSQFDEVLFLDSDNYPLRDPSYLFDEPAFQTAGALFWEGLAFLNSSPIPERSFIWEGSVLSHMMGLDKNYHNSSIFQPMEVDSGQILIHRPKSERSLRMLLFLVGTLRPALPPWTLLGDPDFFRLAWHSVAVAAANTGASNTTSSSTTMNTTTSTDTTTTTTITTSLNHHSFVVVQNPPGILSRISSSSSTASRSTTTTCGDTLVQPDPSGQALFVNRRGAPIRTPQDLIPIWDDLLAAAAGGNHHKNMASIRLHPCFLASVEAQQLYLQERLSPLRDRVLVLEDSILRYATDAFHLSRTEK